MKCIDIYSHTYVSLHNQRQVWKSMTKHAINFHCDLKAMRMLSLLGRFPLFPARQSTTTYSRADKRNTSIAGQYVTGVDTFYVPPLQLTIQSSVSPPHPFLLAPYSLFFTKDSSLVLTLPPFAFLCSFSMFPFSLPVIFHLSFAFFVPHRSLFTS